MHRQVEKTRTDWFHSKILYFRFRTGKACKGSDENRSIQIPESNQNTGKQPKYRKAHINTGKHPKIGV